ncbi:MAG: UbiA family prenyltransferase [Anaerolineae bacterium]|nr:UbiA family prenyltransferase [Phycisphaerae bacterium]
MSADGVNASISAGKIASASSAQAGPPGALARLAIFCSDIKIAHSVFALPFALVSAFLSAKGKPAAAQLALILVCMVTARTVAMAANRLLDAELDRANPRTARRAIPRAALSSTYFIAILTICSLLFVGACAMFGVLFHNWLPLILSVPVLGFVAGYPYLKRFSRLCHYYLGAALALAPICAAIAIAGHVTIDSLFMAAAVLCWTAGFDIIYACQDYEHDLAAGLFSVPAKLGIAGALWVSRITHAISLSTLFALGIHSPELSTLYWIGVAISAGLLIVEHSLVSPGDLSKVGLAFFTVNGIISVLLGALGILDVFF